MMSNSRSKIGVGMSVAAVFVVAFGYQNCGGGFKPTGADKSDPSGVSSGGTVGSLSVSASNSDSNPLRLCSKMQVYKNLVVARGNGTAACPVVNSVYVGFLSTDKTKVDKIVDYGGYAAQDPMVVFDSSSRAHLFVVSSDGNIYHRTETEYWASLGGNVKIFPKQCQNRTEMGESCINFGFSVAADMSLATPEFYITTTNKLDHSIQLRTLKKEWSNLGGYGWSTPVFLQYDHSTPREAGNEGSLD
ncbi:MAG: hypothetical protein K2X47_00980 [Bdellovibrionales bacterium]|nr:hypothetical protein [Bdellovibrionales bacterium]